MKAKEYLKAFMTKHGLSKGEVWEQHELIKLMEGYDSTKPVKNNCDLPVFIEPVCCNTPKNIQYAKKTGRGYCVKCGTPQ